MTTRPPDDVTFLVPGRFRLAHHVAAGSLRADLAALMNALPTARPGLPAGDPAGMSCAEAKAWCAGVIGTLPTKGDQHGSR